MFQNQMQCSHSQRRTQCMLSPTGLPIFSNRQLFQLTQDQKGLFKACNVAGCKVVKKSVVKVYSAQLVGINDELDDPPFGLLYRLSYLAINIFAFWIIGTLELLVSLRPFGDSSIALYDPQAFFSSSFQPFCSISPSTSPCFASNSKYLKLKDLH
ncbi:hypothetical protein H5410_027692 [Solanum commersonii]|uniref:Uncharacterized protein n=1 Tax=Solanum commersonii TaxID=4109 RepID=A0A9J5Z2L8_SOLCO|nr:hypothetical protein H5410_027692 [Solanum commersonii]